MNHAVESDELITKQELSWENLTNTEKIERMRQVIKAQEDDIRTLRQQIRMLGVLEHGRKGVM